MKILEKLKKLEPLVNDDKLNGNPPGALGKRLSSAAVKALTNGIKSAEWKAYMSLFADNVAQLERLTVEKPDDPDYLPLQRAYIVSNAICDIDTTTNTANRTRVELDNNLSSDPDGGVAALRPFVITGLE